MLSFATVSLLVHMIDGVAARVMCVTCGAAWSTANKGMRQSPLYTSKRCTVRVDTCEVRRRARATACLLALCFTWLWRLT
jgi:hypothetical protein